MSKILLTVKEAALELGVNEGSLRNMIVQGKIKAIKEGWRTKIEAREVERVKEKRNKVERLVPHSSGKPVDSVDNSTELPQSPS